MAAEEKEKEESPAAAASAPAPAAGGGKMVLILNGLNIVVTLGVLGVLMISFLKDKNTARVEDMNPNAAAPEAHGGKEGEQGAAKEGEHGAAKKEEASTKMIQLEQFTVNLASVGSGRPRFARVSISLEVPTGDTESEVTRKMPQVRNTVIDLFNSKRPNDLATPEGRNYLKDEIRSAINSFLVSGKLKGVFFTGFALGS